MPYNESCSLWPNHDEHFFREHSIQPLLQEGPHCVSTVLAMLTGEKSAEAFQGHVNTQDPASWSSALRPYGLKLAYCPTDVRKLSFYLPELLALDDLFTLSYYSPTNARILQDPDENGWVCGSHIVILHRSGIFDPANGKQLDATSHHCGDHYTKRIFRLVPTDHVRGL